MRFLESGKFSYGVNYWGSKYAIDMWKDWDAESVENDLKLLKEAGVDALRVFPTWRDFQPLVIHNMHRNEPRVLCIGEEHIGDSDCEKAGVSDEMMRHFEEFCVLCDKYGFDVTVSLITGFMSGRNFLPPAFLTKDVLTDPEAILWEVKFVRYFIGRTKHFACIKAWEYGNETENLGESSKDRMCEENFAVWLCTIGGAIRSADPNRPIISGLAHTDRIQGDATAINCDFTATHPYHIFRLPNESITGIGSLCHPVSTGLFCRALCGGLPCLVEEIGAIGYMCCGRNTEADYMRSALYDAYAHDLRGLWWWCAHDQGFITKNPYDWNCIGSNYGIFDKDYKLKPCGIEARRFMEFIRNIPYGNLPSCGFDGVILLQDSLDVNTLTATGMASYVLAKEAGLNLYFADAAKALPDVPLYVLPSITGNSYMPKHRSDALFEKVKEGAVLYISVGNALMRDFPDISGIEVTGRYAVNKTVKASLPESEGGSELSLHQPWCYPAESLSCQVLMKDEAGEPLYICKPFGKGKIYMLFSPLEAVLSKATAPFDSENAERYCDIYRVFGKDITEKHAVTSSDRFLNVTEHPLSENEKIVIAVNHSARLRPFSVTLSGDWELAEVYGDGTGNGVKLPESIGKCDGCIFRIVRKGSK